MIWGVNPYFIAEPYGLLGSFDVLDLTYPYYNLIMVGVAIACGAGLAWMLGSTRTGKLLVAVIHDTEVSRAMGINVDRMYLYTFTFGSLLAAIGGAFTAPTVSVVPALGVEVIVLSFAVVVIGGLGSLPGAALGAVMVGLVRSAAIHYLPQAELFVIYLVMAMVVFGQFLPQWTLFLVTVALAKGLVVLGLMILLRCGLVSFGQALYYCIGAYAAGMLGRLFGASDVFTLMLAGMAAAGLVGFVLGFLLARYRSIFFGLLSLAVSMILYGLLVKTEALGSTDGFHVLPSTLFGLRPADAWVRYTVLAVALLVAFIAALLVHRYLGTPLGRLASAIKDNEIRVEYMGASARHAIHVKYVIAAALAGLGGALAATTVGHIDPEMAYWTTSGEFIFITILAGTGNVIAPFLGALVFGVIQTVAFGISPNTWQMVLGGSLLVVIVFLPNGLWSLFRGRKAA